MGSILGAVVGAGISRDRGGSGLKGAIEGVIAEKVVRTAVPVAVTIALAWIIRAKVRRSWSEFVNRRAPNVDGATGSRA